MSARRIGCRELMHLADDFQSVAERLALRAEHDEHCDVVCEPNENAACTCGLAELFARLELLSRIKGMS